MKMGATTYLVLSILLFFAVQSFVLAADSDKKNHNLNSARARLASYNKKPANSNVDSSLARTTLQNETKEDEIEKEELERLRRFQRNYYNRMRYSQYHPHHPHHNHFDSHDNRNAHHKTSNRAAAAKIYPASTNNIPIARTTNSQSILNVQSGIRHEQSDMHNRWFNNGTR